MRIYTLGTDDRTEAEISKILSKYQIQVLADIRSSTSSPLPHLRRDNIQKLCGNNKVEYLYLGNELGSDRETGNLDNLDISLYQRGLAILKSLARTRGLLLLCHEYEPTRCNRRLIAEELGSDGAEVLHLLNIEETWTARKNYPSRPDTRQSRPRQNTNRRNYGGDRGRRKPTSGRPGRSEKSGRGERPGNQKKRTPRSKMDKAF